MESNFGVLDSLIKFSLNIEKLDVCESGRFRDWSLYKRFFFVILFNKTNRYVYIICGVGRNCVDILLCINYC